MRNSMLARGALTYSGEASIVTYRRAQRRHARQLVIRQEGDRECVKVFDTDGELLFKRISDGKTRWEQHVQSGRIMKIPVPDRSDMQKRDLFNLSLLAQNYQIKLEGTETVAGRTAHRISISHAGPRPMVLRRVWIDKFNSLELKTETYDPEGEPDRTVAYERVNLTDPPITAQTFVFVPPAGSEPRVMQAPIFAGAIGQAGQKAGFKTVEPTSCPDGFRLYKDMVTVTKYKGAPVLWYQLTDGFRDISVFQRRSDAASADQGRDHRGAHSFIAGQFHFTVVGPLSPDELDKLRKGYIDAQ